MIFGHKSQANRIKLSLTISVRISAFVRCGLNVGTVVDMELVAFALALALPTVVRSAIAFDFGIFSL